MDTHTFARLEALFDELVDLAPAERQKRLDALRRAEPSLADSVAALLDAPREGVDERVRELASLAGEESSTDERVGPYRLLGRIGEGGFGVVWLAEQREPIQRVVAVKVIKPGMDTRAVLARFRSEQQAMALLDHPSIVPAIEAGTTAQGQPYIVMPLVPGMAITRYVQEKRADVHTIVGLMQGVARAIEHAHARGLIHRDIKPANILVATVDGQPVPRIIDFGLAKAMDRSLSDQSTLTIGGELLGTPEYMSPEQAEAKPLDVRTDVYAIGAVLYELLTGRAPIDAERLRSAGRPEVIRRLILESPILPPSAHAPAVPRELDWICLRCLERDPTRRYPTASALAEDLERYLGGLIVAATPPSRWYRARHWIRRYRVPLAVSCVIVTALLGGSGLALQFAIRERAARVQSDAVISFWRGVLTGLDPAISRGRDTTLMQFQLQQARSELERAALSESTEQPVRQMLAEAYANIGEFAAALPLSTRAADLAEKLWGLDDPRSISARTLWFRCQVETRKSADLLEEKEAFHRFMQRALATVPRDSREGIRIASELLSLRELLPVLEVFPQLLRLIEDAERVVGPDDRLTIRLLRAAAGVANPDYAKGLELALEARARAERAFGVTSPEAQLGLGTELFNMVYVRGKAAAYEYGISKSGLLEAALGFGSTPYLATKYNITCLEIELGKYPQAIVGARWLQSVARRSRGVGSVWDDWTLGVLLAAQIRSGIFDEAAATDRELRARSAAKSKPSAMNERIIDEHAQFYIATAYIDAGKLREASYWAQMVDLYSPARISEFKQFLKDRGHSLEELAALDPM